MKDPIINFDLPQHRASIIKVIGVGGGGGNAVNHMYRLGIRDVDFVVCNTDLQALNSSPVPVKLQLGPTISEGRGAGHRPEKGRQAAQESIDQIIDLLKNNTKMVFITAGLGGGTGTGAAPIIAEEAKKLGILTVAIVTMPFSWEGKIRQQNAIQGLNELKTHVDSIIVINNEKIREHYGDMPIQDAFAQANNVLTVAAKGIAEIITIPGYINRDFEDVKTVMANSGVALMGAAEANGPDRAMRVITEALTSPLLNNNDISGARNILLHISSGKDDSLRVDEMHLITNHLQSASGHNAEIIWGAYFDESLEDKIHVTVIATGFSDDVIPELQVQQAKEVIKVPIGLDIQTEPVMNQKPQEKPPIQKIQTEVPPVEPKSEKKIVTGETITLQGNTGVKRTETESVTYPLDKNALEELESQPAILRRKSKFQQPLVDGQNTEPSDDSGTISRYRISLDDDDTMLRETSPYLDKNVD